MRRFNDFVDFRDSLKWAFPKLRSGGTLPKLPPKNNLCRCKGPLKFDCITDTSSRLDSQIRVQIPQGQTSWSAILVKDGATTRSDGQQRDCEEMGAGELSKQGSCYDIQERQVTCELTRSGFFEKLCILVVPYTMSCLQRDTFASLQARRH